jgi:hypothetical protein
VREGERTCRRGLHFNPLNRTFSGTALTGTTAVRVTARDQWGKTVTYDFNITIS